MKFECNIIDNDCASGKTFRMLEQCRKWIDRGQGVVYACRTTELSEELFERATCQNMIDSDRILIFTGRGSVKKLKGAIRGSKPLLIFVTHDSIINLNMKTDHFKKKWILVHDEKPANNNIISIYEDYPDLIEKYPELKNFFYKRPVENNPFRNKTFFDKIERDYQRLDCFNKLGLLKYYVQKRREGNSDDLIYFLHGFLLGCVEYYIRKTDEKNNRIVRFINYNPYNDWKSVFFMFSHSSIDSKHELSFVRKLRLLNVRTRYKNIIKSEKRFDYGFSDRIVIHTTNTGRNWSKTYYTKNNILENTLREIRKMLPDGGKPLVLCNKGYEDVVSGIFGECVLMDGAPYGKEAERYLECDSFVDVSARFSSVQNQGILTDFGFDSSVMTWEKTDDLIQYLMRTKIRRGVHDTFHVFATNSLVANYVSAILGISPVMDIPVFGESDSTITSERLPDSSVGEEYSITIFRNTRDVIGMCHSGTTHSELLKHIPRDNHKNSGCFLFGKTDGMGRARKNIEYLSALVFDFDRKTGRAFSGESYLKSIRSVLGDCLVFWQPTFSHGNYRFIVPVAKNLTPERYQFVMEYLAPKLRNLDPASCRPTQIYFSPRWDFVKSGDDICELDKVIPDIFFRIGQRTNGMKNNQEMVWRNQAKALVLISGIPEKRMPNTNSYCVRMTAKIKGLIGYNQPTNSYIWNLYFKKLDSILAHEGKNRTNDFIRMSFA